MIVLHLCVKDKQESPQSFPGVKLRASSASCRTTCWLTLENQGWLLVLLLPEDDSSGESAVPSSDTPTSLRTGGGGQGGRGACRRGRGEAELVRAEHAGKERRDKERLEHRLPRG